MPAALGNLSPKTLQRCDIPYVCVGVCVDVYVYKPPPPPSRSQKFPFNYNKQQTIQVQKYTHHRRPLCLLHSEISLLKLPNATTPLSCVWVYVWMCICISPLPHPPALKNSPSILINTKLGIPKHPHPRELCRHPCMSNKPPPHIETPPYRRDMRRYVLWRPMLSVDLSLTWTYRSHVAWGYRCTCVGSMCISVLS